MKKNKIKKLALASYTNNVLDEKKVNLIAKFLKKGELKLYLKTLKIYENKKSIVVFVPNILVKNKMLGHLQKIFLNKKIFIKEDQSLIGGLKINDGDNIYDLSLKNKLENLTNFIK